MERASLSIEWLSSKFFYITGGVQFTILIATLSTVVCLVLQNHNIQIFVCLSPLILFTRETQRID